MPFSPEYLSTGLGDRHELELRVIRTNDKAPKFPELKRMHGGILT